MNALVLAAGKSRRIESVAQGKPKPLIEINGEPVLAHNLKNLARYQIKEVWINLHHKADEIRSAIGDGKQWNLSISYSYEKEILGTAGAVKNLASIFGRETFLVVYGDNLTDCNLDRLLNNHRKSGSLATIAAFDCAKSVYSGIIGGKIEINKDDQVIDFVEGNHAHMIQSNWVNAGVYALEPEIFSFMPEGFSDFGKDVFPKALQNGEKISIFRHEGYCLAIDTPESYAKALQNASMLTR